MQNLPHSENTSFMRDAWYCPVKQIRVTTDTVAKVIIPGEFSFTTLWRVDVVRFTQGPYTTCAIRVVSWVTKCLYIKKNNKLLYFESFVNTLSYLVRPVGRGGQEGQSTPPFLVHTSLFECSYIGLSTPPF